MIIECVEEEKETINNYIGKSYYKCLYLYLDIEKYGFSNKNIKIWIQTKNDKIVALILLYYTGMHVFSQKHDYDLSELCDFIKEIKPSMICGEKTTICNIYNNLNVTEYFLETGWVRKLENFKNFSRDDVMIAGESDFYQIAKLLYEDEDLGSSYKLEELKNQLQERNKQGFVRNYIIKKDNQVVCHAGTGAENKKLAILSYVITKPDYRNMGYAKKVCSAVCEDLLNEKKEIFLINYSKESTSLYNKLGFIECCEWGKIFLNLKNIK